MSDLTNGARTLARTQKPVVSSLISALADALEAKDAEIAGLALVKESLTTANERANKAEAELAKLKQRLPLPGTAVFDFWTVANQQADKAEYDLAALRAEHAYLRAIYPQHHKYGEPCTDPQCKRAHVDRQWLRTETERMCLQDRQDLAALRAAVLLAVGQLELTDPQLADRLRGAANGGR